MIERLSTGYAGALVVLSLLGCGGTKVDPLLQLSTQESLERGKELMAQEKYSRAQRYLDHAFEASPNSREGREALLLSADALYLDGGVDSYIRCEAKYRDFLNRFPTSDRSDYAQLQIGNCLAQRMEKPDRDQQVALKALEAYQEMLRLYPTSIYAGEAESKAGEVANNLAEGEFMVGFFYLRYRLCRAAIQRFAELPELYPGYDQMDKVIFYLGRAYGMCRLREKAEETFRQLTAEYPDSSYLTEVPKVLIQLEKQKERG